MQHRASALHDGAYHALGHTILMVRADSTVVMVLLLSLERGLEKLSGINAIASVIFEDGYVVLRGHFSKRCLASTASAAPVEWWRLKCTLLEAWSIKRLVAP